MDMSSQYLQCAEKNKIQVRIWWHGEEKEVVIDGGKIDKGMTDEWAEGGKIKVSGV